MENGDTRVIETRVNSLEKQLNETLKVQKESYTYLAEEQKKIQATLSSMENNNMNTANKLELTLSRLFNKLDFKIEGISKDLKNNSNELSEHISHIKEHDVRIDTLETKVERILLLGGIASTLLIAAATGILQNLLNSLF